jgi:hypothetical protein
MSQFNLDPRKFSGRTLVDSDEQPIGQISGVFQSHPSDLPKWVAVTCEDNLQHVVPFNQIEVAGPYVKVPYSSRDVVDSATATPDLTISVNEERRLSDYYGLPEGLYEPYGPPPTEDPIGPEGALRFFSFSYPKEGATVEQTQIGPERPKGPPPDEDRIGPET